MPRAGIQRFPDHHARLGPGVRRLQRRDSRDDFRVSLDWLVHVLKLVGTAPNRLTGSRHRERSRRRGRCGAGPHRTSDVAIPPRRWQSRSDLEVREVRCCQLCRVSARHRQADVYRRRHADRCRRDRRPGPAIGRAVGGEAAALSYEAHPCWRVARSTRRSRRLAAGARASLQRGTHAWGQRDESVPPIGRQSITDHEAGFAPVVGRIEAGHARTDVDVPAHHAVGELKLVSSAPDVVSASSNRPRSARQGRTTPRCRTPDVAIGPAGWQRA